MAKGKKFERNLASQNDSFYARESLYRCEVINSSFVDFDFHAVLF